MRAAELSERLRGAGARPVHVARLLRHWLQVLPDTHGAVHLDDFLPLAVRCALPAWRGDLAALAGVRAQHAGAGDAIRLLVGLADGQAVESVLLPRGGVCVSTQVGCAVGCGFCMTGRDGLIRQLGSAEILAQVVLARALRPVKKVVFMGMGEPAHNLDNVLESIELLGTHGAIGHKNLVLSTVGDHRVFARLPQQAVKPALALSLHSTKAALRAALMPRAPRIAPEDLVALCTAWAEATGYPIQYQWTLLAGVNDGDDEIDGIARLLAGRYAVMNLIPWNAVEGGGYTRPSPERLSTMARELNARGVLTKLRDSAGQDIDGGCGQLRARAQVPGACIGAPVT